MIRKCTLAGNDHGKKLQKMMQSLLIKICMHAKAKNMFIVMDFMTASVTANDYRPYADRVDASDAL